jgi:hypothetical protein
MLTGTPEYNTAHQQDLNASANRPGATAAIARRRRDRRAAIRRVAATVYNAIPFRAHKPAQKLRAETETTANGSRTRRSRPARAQ